MTEFGKSLRKLLRYNCRHHLFIPRGFDGKHAPQRNPTCSSNRGANGKSTISLHEPYLLFRLRQRVFCFAGKQRCPDRGEYGQYNQRDGRDHPTPDTWDIGPDGYRTCSYCGSFHFDDFKALVRKCVETNAEEVGIEGTTKAYKVYVRQRGVRNAGEGGIKFYMGHVVMKDVTPEDERLLAEAFKVTNAWYDREREARLARMAAGPRV